MSLAQLAITKQPGLIDSYIILIQTQIYFSKYEDAQKSLNTARDQWDSPLLDLLSCQILAAQGNSFQISTILASINTSNQLEPGQLTVELINILRVVVKQWSPVLLVQYINLFHRELGAWMQRKVIGQVIANLSALFLEQFQNDAKTWHETLPSLEKTVGNVKQCEMPLRLLRAVVDRCYKGNDGPLLELALEERQLVEKLIDEKERHNRNLAIAQASRKSSWS